MKIVQTKRYTVAAGIRADLCVKCELAAIDRAAIERAGAHTTNVLGANDAGQPDAYELLNHSNYTKIHPHPSRILKNICDPAVPVNKIVSGDFRGHYAFIGLGVYQDAVFNAPGFLEQDEHGTLIFSSRDAAVAAAKIAGITSAEIFEYDYAEAS